MYVVLAMRTESLTTVLAILAACFSANCGNGATAADPPPSAVPLSTATIRLGLDSTCTATLKTLSVPVASSDGEKYTGLSGRRKPLAPGDGMLFEFMAPVEDSFYMRDTTIPLSIAFFGVDHRLIQSFEMAVEPDPARPSRLYSPNSPYLDALEAAPGSFAEMTPGEVYLCIA